MKTQFTTSFDGFFFTIVTTIFLALGSLGVFREVILYVATAFGLMALLYLFIKNGEVGISTSSLAGAVFVIALFVHTITTNGILDMAMLFVSGFVFSLFVNNFYKTLSDNFTYILTGLGILMGVLYIFYSNNSIILPNLVSLFMPATESIKHSNIGDFWAIILTGLLYKYGIKKSWIYIPFILAGICFTSLSYSRSAIVSLLAGLFYIFYKHPGQKSISKIFTYSVLLATFLFLYTGLSKTTIFARPYYLESIVNFFRFPLGTGLGNFSMVSSSSNLTHNIVLEFISGMGVFAVFFLYWLIGTVVKVFKTTGEGEEFGAIFIATLVNFLFNTTYTIPSLVWILFISGALALQKTDKIHPE